ncbi:helix-turn-helix domain-containing protein [Micromonospora gifhornensis]|uniref:HxlR family transcriptional regulator n=1 Tax=Micromonospora gifhornensis TaxID=84594 RepID=A0ABQ4IM58_9ACTN|nr:HxlR family transcriptional regulator [Micromonospora gifhornensis]
MLLVGFTGKRYGADRNPLVPFDLVHDAHGQVFLADCPTRLAVEIIAEKWAVIVLFALSLQPRRPGELAHLIGGISHKVLTQTLRRLQAYGLVERRAYAEAPPRVEYSLTPLGQTLVEPIKVLTDWARDNGAAIVEFQEQNEH